MKPIGYYFLGKFYKFDNPTEAFVDAFEKFAEYDRNFLSKFENKKSNNKTNKRHLISMDKSKLYMASPHLSNSSMQMKSGYWIATNYKTQDKISFIKDACQIIGLEYGKDIRCSFETEKTIIKNYVCNEKTRIFINAAGDVISPIHASYDEIYFCAFCKGFSFLRKQKDRGAHFYHKKKPNIECPQYVGGRDEFMDGEITNHNIDYEKRLQETIAQLIENGNESWLDGQLDFSNDIKSYSREELPNDSIILNEVDNTQSVMSVDNVENSLTLLKHEIALFYKYHVYNKKFMVSPNGLINQIKNVLRYIIKENGHISKSDFKIILNWDKLDLLKYCMKYFSKSQIFILNYYNEIDIKKRKNMIRSLKSIGQENILEILDILIEATADRSIKLIDKIINQVIVDNSNDQTTKDHFIKKVLNNIIKKEDRIPYYYYQIIRNWKISESIKLQYSEYWKQWV